MHPTISHIDSIFYNRTTQAVLLFIGLCLCCVFADFSTKGEPREALVAVEMLRSGNWILPIDGSGDMAYKPPMFHWLVCLFSLPAGHVTEFTSRLPSVLALTLLTMLTAHFAGKARGQRFGTLCAGFMVTAFEVLRAGTIARVDMVLTAFMVAAIIFLFKSRQSSPYKYMLAAVLCMSGGALTKGPVAIILPLGVYWIWALCCKESGFLILTGRCIVLAVLSLIIPALWYMAAYRQGGERFLNLALEENFGRFTGKMTYDSHVKPVWYNFTSLLTGWLPWSFGVLLTLLSRRVRAFCAEALRSIRSKWSSMTPASKLCLIASLVIFVFYCIPKSKRSVYLLPVYPFMAYGFACYALSLVRLKVISTKALKRIFAVTGILLFCGFAIAFPIYSRKDSDRYKAERINAIVPAGPIYTFIPDRFIRFYITDFYLGGRLVSLLPSAQVEDAPLKPDASLMRIPDEKSFYLLTTADLFDTDKDFGLHEWLNSNGLIATPVFRADSKGHDVKGYFILLQISKQQ